MSLLIPNSSQVPNFLLDRLMPVIDAADFKILCMVCRKTFGWQKSEDRISLTQFEQGTGLSRGWLNERLTVLSSPECNLLIKTRTAKGCVWQLNLECDTEQALTALNGQYSECTSTVSVPLLVHSVASASTVSVPTKQTNTKPSKPIVKDSELEARLRTVWDYYLQKTDRSEKGYSFSPERKKQGISRLKECLSRTKGDYDKAAALMCLCIDRLAESDFHMGRDAKTNGKNYKEWHHLFRSLEKMEEWWNK